MNFDKPANSQMTSFFTLQLQRNYKPSIKVEQEKDSSICEISKLGDAGAVGLQDFMPPSATPCTTFRAAFASGMQLPFSFDHGSSHLSLGSFSTNRFLKMHMTHTRYSQYFFLETCVYLFFLHVRAALMLTPCSVRKNMQLVVGKQCFFSSRLLIRCQTLWMLAQHRIRPCDVYIIFHWYFIQPHYLDAISRVAITHLLVILKISRQPPSELR